MTHAIHFDTHAFVKTLESKGVAPEQAEAHVIALQQVIDDTLSTKLETDAALNRLSADIHLLRNDLESKINGVETKLESKINGVEARLESVESKLEHKIAESKNDILRWVFGIALGQAALTITTLISTLKFFR